MKIGSMPCAPSIVFGLGDDSGAAKALMIRHMLKRGFMMSGQLYVMWPHIEEMVASMLSALDESLALVATACDCGALRSESGVQAAQQGFARLA